MAWSRANETQQALSAAESRFLELCESDDEIEQTELEEAEEAMQQAAADADDALNEMRQQSDDWASIFARILR